MRKKAKCPGRALRKKAEGAARRGRRPGVEEETDRALKQMRKRMMSKSSIEERDFAQAWKRATLTDVRLISTEIERSCFNFRGISSPQI